MVNQFLNWRHCVVDSKTYVADALQRLNNSGTKILLCLDDNDQLIGTVTDGDLRRGMLNGCTMQDPIMQLVHRNPFTVLEHSPVETVQRLMQFHKILQIPVVNLEKKVVGLYLWEDFNLTEPIDNIMVIMAGGQGKRLRPFTQNCPKPMVEINGKPMLEHILNKAYSEGFRNFVISINYLGHMISDYFGDGADRNMNISYLNENMPLGTAGALSLLQPTPELPFIVTNGDVLTGISYASLLQFCFDHAADAVMALKTFEYQNPYGVVHTNDLDIIGFEEKPISTCHVNAGIYALTAKIFDFVEANRFYNMPELFSSMRENHFRTLAYLVHEEWVDVGRPNDLRIAATKFPTN